MRVTASRIASASAGLPVHDHRQVRLAGPEAGDLLIQAAHLVLFQEDGRDLAHVETVPSRVHGCQQTLQPDGSENV